MARRAASDPGPRRCSPGSDSYRGRAWPEYPRLPGQIGTASGASEDHLPGAHHGTLRDRQSDGLSVQGSPPPLSVPAISPGHIGDRGTRRSRLGRRIKVLRFTSLSQAAPSSPGAPESISISWGTPVPAGGLMKSSASAAPIFIRVPSAGCLKATSSLSWRNSSMAMVSGCWDRVWTWGQGCRGHR